MKFIIFLTFFFVSGILFYLFLMLNLVNMLVMFNFFPNINYNNPAICLIKFSFPVILRINEADDNVPGLQGKECQIPGR